MTELTILPVAIVLLLFLIAFKPSNKLENQARLDNLEPAYRPPIWSKLWVDKPGFKEERE